MNNSNQYQPFYFTNPIKVILPIQNEFPLYIREKDNNFDRIIGQNGTIAFILDYKDLDGFFNISDLEEKTKFETELIDELNNEYKVVCRLWNPINENLVIICNLEENLKNENRIITLKKSIFPYKQYNISIYAETSVKVKQYNYNISFIYSDKPIISEDYQIYNFEFKLDSYNDNDIFYLSGSSQFTSNILFQSWVVYKKISRPYITKTIIEYFLSKKNKELNLESLKDNYGVCKYKFVYNLNIKYEIKEKEDIYIKITKLLNNVSESGNIVAYNTNISNINNTQSSEFTLPFNRGWFNFNCYFKKNNITNLLLLCQITEKLDISLDEIRNEIVLNNLNYKYNFRIQPVSNDEKIKVNNEGTLIELLYPEELDFTLKNSSYIYYKMSSPNNVEKIKLNSSSELLCENLNLIKKCIVNISHFDSHITGYYYTYHLNHLNEYSIYYDANPIYIKFCDKPDEKTNVITDYKTDGITDFTTDEITDYKTDEKTDEKTSIITDYKTDGMTDYKTDGITDFTTDEKTDYITDYITDYKTDGMTDYKTDEKTNMITDYKTDEKTNVITDYKTDGNTDYKTDEITDEKIDDKTNKEDKNNALIIGFSIVGGIIILGLIAFFAWKYYKRNNKNIINKDLGNINDSNRCSLDGINNGTR